MNAWGNAWGFAWGDSWGSQGQGQIPSIAGGVVPVIEHDDEDEERKRKALWVIFFGSD